MKAALLALVGFLAVCSIVYGVLDIFAGGMSDAPDAGREASEAGLWIAGCGLGALIAVIVAAIL